MLEFQSITDFALIGLGGLLAGTMDAMAGGGGMISLPILIGLGLPPDVAIGTNKLQSSMGTTTAALNYMRHGLVAPKRLALGIFVTAIGAMLGSCLNQTVDNNTLRLLIPAIIFGLFVFSFFKKSFGLTTTKAKMNPLWFYTAGGLLIGGYDGFLGPGTGVFWTLAFVSLLGFEIKKATAHTKIMNLTSNYVALAMFIYFGKVYFKVGFVMAAGTIVGAWIGSTLVTRIKRSHVRKVFLLVTGAVLIHLVVTTYIV